MENNIPRRNQINKMAPEELLIWALIQQIEKLGAHPYLTDVVVLLGQAQNKLADWIDFEDLKINV